MNVKHFLKTLLMFTGMIIVGLIGVFVISYFDKGESTGPNGQSTAGIAK